ncbi:hypothetical protein CRG98_037288 [Punica granatum]|uniref:Retrotransposon gag domain-containing protein n=1 Tax=Punica granatum TaxID=22663 RepID=A0A2I0IE88_PUNGR|nr:hypothetical protein CRG98_037288 [Punica granatum]
MPSLITIPPGLAAVLSPKEVQRLIGEKVAKAIQATERKQLGLPSLNENLESPISQDILNTKELFIQRFAATRRVKRDLNELFTMEQKEGETLRAWYKDLFKVFTKIESLSPRKAMSAFQRGLRKRRLKKSLIVRKTLLIL